MSFTVAINTDLSQKVIQIRQTDATDIGGETSFSLSLYGSQTGAALYAHVFTAPEITAMKAGLCYLNDVFPTIPADGYYYAKVIGNSLSSGWDSVAFTLNARSEVYSRMSQIDVYSPDYSVSTLLYTTKMLLDEMEQIQNLDFSNQKKIDFDVRLDQINAILSV